MELVKLDSYEYEIRDILDGKGRYIHTIVEIEFDSMFDMAMYDIYNELSNTKRVHINGRYFVCVEMHQQRHDISRGATLVLILLEDFKKAEGI